MFSSSISIWICFTDSICCAIFLKFLEFLTLFLTVSEEFYNAFFYSLSGRSSVSSSCSSKLIWSFVHFIGRHQFPHLCLFLFLCCPSLWPFTSVSFFFKKILSLCLLFPNLWVGSFSLGLCRHFVLAEFLIALCLAPPASPELCSGAGQQFCCLHLC